MRFQCAVTTFIDDVLSSIKHSLDLKFGYFIICVELCTEISIGARHEMVLSLHSDIASTKHMRNSVGSNKYQIYDMDLPDNDAMFK